MKNNKKSAFTLAELMVILLTLTIMLAAFSPVLTTRVINAENDDVWSRVPNDDNYDAFLDDVTKSNPSQAFIGLAPNSHDEVGDFSQDNNSVPNTIYSKLVIRATNSLTFGLAGNNQQKQMHFRYGASGSNLAGDLTGSLFADNNGNFLLGGAYNNNISGENNSAYGAYALSPLSTGSNNTAIGYNSIGFSTAVPSTFTGSDNTVVGNNINNSNSASKGNTIICAESCNTGKDYNTIIGRDIIPGQPGANASYNTIIGMHNMAESITDTFNNNTAIGEWTMGSIKKGSYNTAVGRGSLKIQADDKTSEYNTAIGHEAGSWGAGKYKTFIASNNQNSHTENNPSTELAQSMIMDDEERIYIGPKPSNDGVATLEIHNVDGINANSLPMENVPNASVVINGDLIVRGRTYLESSITGYENASTANRPKGLVYHTAKPIGRDYSVQAFAGHDGIQRTESSKQNCDNTCRSHAYKDISESCICTMVNSSVNKLGRNFSVSNPTVSDSYDWFTATSYDSSWDTCQKTNTYGAKYTDKSYNKDITVSTEFHSGNDSVESHRSEHSYAHDMSTGASSCCPILYSDIRLKNIKEKFTAGLDEIKKINVYNFSFKSDKNKLPQIGVIAQDLKKIFPSAIVNENGFYKIRRDEMFFALINSIKELKIKLDTISKKIENNSKRLVELKQENIRLNNQLDKLSDELLKLEETKK